MLALHSRAIFNRAYASALFSVCVLLFVTALVGQESNSANSATVNHRVEELLKNMTLEEMRC